jgi:hypothetical protein
MMRAWAGGLLLLAAPFAAGASADVPADGTADVPALAILGDSLSTGAATHPALEFDTLNLWRVFTGALPVAPRRGDLPADLAATLGDPLPPPQRLWPSAREFFGGPDWVWRNTLQTLSRAYLDTAEYSWGYMLGAALGVPPRQIALAGEDGARVQNISRHMDRVLDASGGVLPRRVAILYTGNDLCGAAINQTTPAADFASDLASGLGYLARNGRPGAQGTDVYVLSYLSVLQLLTSDSILDKKVRAFGGEMSCRALREAGYRAPEPASGAAAVVETLPADAWWFQAFMPPSPAAFCQTLFSPVGPEREQTLNALANRIRDYRERQQEVVRSVGDRLGSASGIRFHYLAGTADVTFTGDDVALDCFHLSVAGQAKIARAALAGIRAAEAPAGMRH